MWICCLFSTLWEDFDVTEFGSMPKKKLYVIKLFSPSFLYLLHLCEYVSHHYNLQSPHTLFCVVDSWTWTISLEALNFDKLRHWHFALSDVTCRTTAQADIVLLVDGSWSIGRLNFKTIRAFIARMVGVFDIGPERVQIGGSTKLIFTN